MTENNDGSPKATPPPKTPGMEKTPRDETATGTPGRTALTPPAKTTFKPAVPKFGNVTEIAKDTWITWTGGKPNKDWTQLEDPSQVALEWNANVFAQCLLRAEVRSTE